MQYLIIPPWLSRQQNTLRFNNMAYTDIRQLERLMSGEDLATYLLLQDNAWQILGGSVLHSHLLRPQLDGLSSPLGDSRINPLLDLMKVYNTQTIAQTLFAGIDNVVDLQHVCMIPTLISGNTIGIFFEHCPSGDPVALRRSFLEALINILYAFNNFETIAAQPYFKEYLYLSRHGRLPLMSTIETFCETSDRSLAKSPV